MFRTAAHSLCNRTTSAHHRQTSSIRQSTRPKDFFTIINQYERGVTLTFGKLTTVKEPGFRIALPWIQEVSKVDLRTFVRDLSKQDVITSDNISIKVDAIVYFAVFDPAKSICAVQDYEHAVCELAQVKLRESLSHSEVNDILHNREKLSKDILEAVAPTAEEWGIRVSGVQLKDIKFDEGMIRAMSRKAEASRERDATIIHAQAQVDTANKLLEAAQALEKSPVALRLRELDALAQMAKEKSHSTIVVPSGLLDTMGTSFRAASVVAPLIAGTKTETA
eukprot:TRINITY_DN4123_c0_g1_i1.p1 TRINITY_DN4123_c0_g1~~TRINITY_DN4123_c0_g1_i1.p1  ORF type:complete len:279 (-),score=55.23 TRINITY_DN4123_c0_g1_i1:106-942(-)